MSRLDRKDPGVGYIPPNLDDKSSSGSYDMKFIQTSSGSEETDWTNDEPKPISAQLSSLKSVKERGAVLEFLLGRKAPLTPALASRLRDFSWARTKRARTGEEKPVGIMGLYEHIAAVRRDIEWVEECNHRRALALPYKSWRTFEDGETEALSTIWSPSFTFILMISLTAVYICEMWMNGWYIEPLATNPMIGVSSSSLVAMGARESDLIVNSHEYWRLITSNFLHCGIVHLGFNLAVLSHVSVAFERSHGARQTALVFLLGGYFGNTLSAIFLPQFISVGASGGIFALFGAALADIFVNWSLVFGNEIIQLTSEQRSSFSGVLCFLFLDVFFNVAIGFLPLVDNFCHVGGMLFGFLLGVGLIQRVTFDFFGIKRGLISNCGTFFMRAWGLVLAFVLLVSATLILVEHSDGFNTPCQQCRYLSCIEMPPWSDDKWWNCDDCSKAYGSAEYNDDDSAYTVVNLVCPDDSAVTFDLDEPVYDVNILNRNLATMCREHCGEGVYSATSW